MVIAPNDIAILTKLSAMAATDRARRPGGGAAWPSQDWLGEQLGIARETVNRRIRGLVAGGYLRVFKVGTAGAWLRNVYRLTRRGYELLGEGMKALGRRIFPLQSVCDGVLTLGKKSYKTIKTIPERAQAAAARYRAWIVPKAKALFRRELESLQARLTLAEMGRREPDGPGPDEAQLAWEARTRAEFIARCNGLAKQA